MRYGLPYKGSKNAIAEWVVNQLPSAEYFVCKYSEKEWHGNLDAIKIEISDNNENTNRESTYPWEDERNEKRT